MKNVHANVISKNALTPLFGVNRAAAFVDNINFANLAGDLIQMFVIVYVIKLKLIVPKIIL
jgi:hypothetical protein